MVVQRAPPIRLVRTPVLTDMNSEPVELIRAFDPVMRGGTDSRTTWAAFNQAWRRKGSVEFGVCGICACIESQKREDGDHRGVFLDRLSCLILY